MSRSVWTLCLICLFAGSSTAMSQEFRFEADWLYLGRDNGSNQNFISGPDSFSADDADYGFQSGYRFTLGGSSEYYDVELVFSQLDDWSDSTTSTLGTLLILDDSGVPPFNSLAFRNAIFDASTTAAVGNDESNESERINSGATLLYSTSSDLKSFELNFGSNRAANWWSFGLGYQHLLFNDASSLLISGTFDAVDLGAPPGNDGLAHLSLTGAGLGLVSGGADGFDAAGVPVAGPDILAMSYIGDAENELNGLQAIIGGRFYPSDSLVIESLTKLGLYHNQVRANFQETYIGSGQDDSIYQRVLSDESTVASFVGSTTLRAIVPLTDYISFMAGYEVMVLTNVALGSDQPGGLGTSLLGATTYHADAGGHAIIHGTSLGLEVVW
jgi:hypothetical protein